MNEEIVELLVRLACGESAEPPVLGTVALHGERFRVWKQGERRRVETVDGELRSIRTPERSLDFPVGGGVPVESSPGAFDHDEEDEPWVLIRRPDLRELDLRERRLDGSVVRGQRFGRETATFTLPEREDEEIGLTYVLDVTTGMPLELVEDGEEVLRWHELEVVDAIDPQLLSWDGEVTESGWFAYVGVALDRDDEVVSGDPIPASLTRRLSERARRRVELRDSLGMGDLVVEAPLEFEDLDVEAESIWICLEPRARVSIQGAVSPDDLGFEGPTWTTADGWTWAIHVEGVDDPSIERTVRERITRWREREAT